MKTKMTKRLLLLVALLVTTFSFSSCEKEDWEAEYNLMGEWKIVEINRKYGNCPYQPSDRFMFYRDKTIETWGYGGLHEFGDWYIGKYNGYSTLHIRFEGSYEADISADMRSFSEDYLVLDVIDRSSDPYSSNPSRYTLRLIRKY